MINWRLMEIHSTLVKCWMYLAVREWKSRRTCRPRLALSATRLDIPKKNCCLTGPIWEQVIWVTALHYYTGWNEMTRTILNHVIVFHGYNLIWCGVFFISNVSRNTNSSQYKLLHDPRLRFDAPLIRRHTGFCARYTCLHLYITLHRPCACK